MATYKGIQGYSVQKLSSDPTVEDTIGQLFYNSTSGKFKISTQGAAAWSSGGSLNTARGKAGNAGTQTAALWAGGSDTPTDLTEIYDGTSWTEVNDLNTPRIFNSGTGTATAAISAGGRTPGPPSTRISAVSEEYDGTSWTEGGDIPAVREAGSGAGTTSASLYIGGTPPSPPGVDIVLINDGTSWAVSPATLNTSRYQAAAVGITTAAMYIGGTPAIEECESFNGSTWTEVGDIPDPGTAGAASSGTQALALLSGGGPFPSPSPTPGTHVYSWDGTSWTTTTSLTTGRINLGGTPSGTSSVAMVYGGGDGPQFDQTEEWNDPVYAIKTVTVS
jgi:hypothetical protein